MLRATPFAAWLIATLLLLTLSACAHVDSKIPGPSVTQNGLVVTLELDPAPARTDGEVVLIDVQDLQTKAFVPNARVRLLVSQLRPPHRRISVRGTDSENSGIYDADVTLKTPGPWLFDVSVAVAGRRAHLQSLQNAVRPTPIS